MRHAVLYEMSLAGFLSGCGNGTSCSEGYVYDGEECVADSWQWEDRYSFDDVRDACASLGRLDAPTFCEGLEGKTNYNSCMSAYDSFQKGLGKTVASFDGSQADVYVADIEFSYNTSDGLYEGKVPTITFQQGNLLLSCEAYRINEGCLDDRDVFFRSDICYTDSLDQNGFFGSCMSGNLPSLTILLNASQCPGLSRGVVLQGDSSFSTDTLAPDQALLHNSFSQTLQDMVCDANQYAESLALCYE